VIDETGGPRMAADPNDGVRYLIRGRIADFLRTKTAIAIWAFVVGGIVGMSVGQTVANVSYRSQIEEFRKQIDSHKMEFDSLKVRLDALTKK
jgi:hypothetical protein